MNLLEFVEQRGSDLDVDVDNAVIRGVRVLGLSSANGRDYLPATVKAPLPLYEGRPTNCDHPSRPGEATTIARRNGWLESARQDSDGGMRADWHLLRSHPMTAMILEVAARNPTLLGLSHNVSGRVRRENGREIVEAIDEVLSVDVVADPATVKGLHEGRAMTTRSTVQHIMATLRDTRPDYVRGLTEQAEAGIMSGDTAMDMPAEAPATGEADHETALKAGFRAAVMAIMDDEGLDTAAKLKKMRDVLRAEEKLIGGGSTDTGAGAGEEAGEGEAMPAEESRKLKLENTGLKLLLEAGVRPSKVLTRALAGCSTEAEMKELLEEYRAGGGGTAQRPRSAAPPASSAGGNGQRLQEQDSLRSRGERGQEQEVPSETKQLARWLSTRD